MFKPWLIEAMSGLKSVFWLWEEERKKMVMSQSRSVGSVVVCFSLPAFCLVSSSFTSRAMLPAGGGLHWGWACVAWALEMQGQELPHPPWGRRAPAVWQQTWRPQVSPETSGLCWVFVQRRLRRSRSPPFSHVLQTRCLSEVACVAVSCSNVDSHVLSVGATEAGIVSLDLCHMI